MATRKTDAGIRAEYRELARRIIANDRKARKNGLSQNTIGEIERALVAAYRRGQSVKNGTEEATAQQYEKEFVDWIDVPPRCRETLWLVSIGLFRKSEADAAKEVLLEQVRVSGRLRWRELGSPLSSETKTFSEGGVAPLVRLGLLSKSSDGEERLVLSPKGIATCKEFWRRWRRSDPTLPIENVRV